MPASKRTRAWLAAMVGCVGCTANLGRVGAIVPGVDRSAKLLRPNATARLCGSWLLGISLDGNKDLLAEALRDLVAMDGEADLIAKVWIETEVFATGLFNRDCVVVHGDVAREASTMVLPKAFGHVHPAPSPAR